MRSNNMFREQVNTVTNWFTGWSECEKTVALYSLLKQIPPLQCQFLVQVLQQRLADNKEVLRQEEEANDPGFIAQLFVESKEKIIRQLLSHLPLLHSGNPKAKTEYLKLISMILTHSIEHGVYIEESRQLLSYSLIHPAISSDERSNFNKWLTQLNERFSGVHQQSFGGQGQYIEGQGQNQGQGQQPGQGQGYFSNQGEQQTHFNFGRQAIGSGRANGFHHAFGQNFDQSRNGFDQSRNGFDQRPVRSQGPGNAFYDGVQRGPNRQTRPWTSGHPRVQSTNSAPPNFNNMMPSSTSSGTQPPSQRINTHPPLMRAPSYQVQASVKNWLDNNHREQPDQGQPAAPQSDHAPLSPQSSSASSGSGSGSDTHQETFNPWSYEPQRNTYMEEGSGMRDVPLWLKKLRLHKYAVLLQELTYDEMMNISDEWLEKRHVTKGARHKIILNINKLKERQSTLRELEKDIVSGNGSLWKCITEMNSLLNTPIRVFKPSSTPTSSSSPAPGSQTPEIGAKGDTIAEGDIPSQFTSLMAKVCSKLLTSNSMGLSHSFNMYLKLIDKCINHEAFSQKQKKLMVTWKQQAGRIWQPAPFKYGMDKRIWPYGGNNQSYMGAGYWNFRPNPWQAYRPPPSHPGMQWSFGGQRSVYGGTNNPPSHTPLHRNNSLNTPVFSRPSLMEQQTKQALTRTQSAPQRSQPIGFGSQAPTVESSADTEINARLDSLCRSVTEHALGPSNSGEPGQDADTYWRQNYF